MTETTRKETEMTEMYREVGLEPAAGGFGEWQRADAYDGELYSDPDEFASAVVSEFADSSEEARVYCLSDPEISEEEMPCKDIRGLIHHEPDVVFAVVVGEGEDAWTSYRGLDLVTVGDAE